MDKCIACRIPFAEVENEPIWTPAGDMCEDCALEWDKAVNRVEKRKEDHASEETAHFAGYVP